MFSQNGNTNHHYPFPNRIDNPGVEAQVEKELGQLQHPVAFNELRKQSAFKHVSKNILQRAVWSLIDHNKVELTTEFKLRLPQAE